MAKNTWKGGELLLDLADFLENDPRVKGHFDMDFVLCDSGGGKPEVDARGRIRVTCGTAACAMGWAPMVPALRRAGLRYGVYNGRAWSLVLNGEWLPFDTTARLLFDISAEHCDKLFYKRPDHSTPKQVARNIRRFVTAERKRRGINVDA